MKNKYLSFVISIMVFMILAACQTNISQQKFPTMTFQNLSQIKLMVNNIKVISKIKIDLTPSNVAHKLPITPEKAIIQWARDCLSIAGNKNTARMIIIDAKAREISLDLDEGLTGIFKNQQSHRFEAIIKARLEIMDDSNNLQAFVTGSAQKSITISEATSMSDRRQIWYNLIEKLMNKFNLVMQKNIKQNLQNYLF